MCGRFAITLQTDDYEEKFELIKIPDDFFTRYNVAPTQLVAVVRGNTNNQVEWMRWGLVPSWAKDPSIGVRMINARSETLLEKPSFREAFVKRRCLILADGFYEWQKFPDKHTSVPHYFSLKDHTPFVFAGLWESWKQPDNGTLLSCTIITCEANRAVAPIHERMPVMFNQVTAQQWLTDSPLPQLQSLLRPYPEEEMQEITVSSLINNPAIDSPELIRPA